MKETISTFQPVPAKPMSETARTDTRSKILSLYAKTQQEQSCTVPKVKKNSPDEWLIFENTQEPIIDENTFIIMTIELSQ